MAKTSYKIPETLDTSFGDMEISIRGDNGIGVKPLPIKVILAYIASFFGCFWTINNTFISSGSVALKVCYVILWIGLTFILLSYDKTKQFKFWLVPTFINYLFKGNRVVFTRRSGDATRFYMIAGIDNVDQETGMISFTDGTFGFMYRVVGSGSILLFDEDKEAILNRVDNFYKKMKTDYELIFMTCKESQKVYRQIGNLKIKYDRLDPRDKELRALADMQYDYLKNYVGGSFRSIHQYMLIKADNEEALMIGRNMLQSEVENSQMMFKQCTALFDDDLLEVFGRIYKGKESI